jgi:hypothetical protein
LRRNRIAYDLADAISLPAEYQQRAPRIRSIGAAPAEPRNLSQILAAKHTRSKPFH